MSTHNTVLKSPGDHIEEDEPIVQIETDKVTIDVRSPCSGTVDVILVKPDDNVSVNHVVAAIIQGEAPAKAEGTAPPVHASSSSSITSTTTSSATPTVAGGSGDHHHGYRPRISFPPRRTPQGDIISMMPREQAQQALQSKLIYFPKVGGKLIRDSIADVCTCFCSGLGASHGAKSTIVSPSAPQSAQPTQQPQRRIIPSSAEGPPLPRKTMSEAEIEAIMLGGAM